MNLLKLEPGDIILQAYGVVGKGVALTAIEFAGRFEIDGPLGDVERVHVAAINGEPGSDSNKRLKSYFIIILCSNIKSRFQNPQIGEII